MSKKIEVIRIVYTFIGRIKRIVAIYKNMDDPFKAMEAVEEAVEDYQREIDQYRRKYGYNAKGGFPKRDRLIQEEV